jgi:hypothetical protein
MGAFAAKRLTSMSRRRLDDTNRYTPNLSANRRRIQCATNSSPAIVLDIHDLVRTSSNGCESLVKIRFQIVDVLDAQRQAHGVFRHAGFVEFCR